MTIAPRLDLRQTQSLVMTPQLQQAIKLLQMSNQELGEFVATEIEQNPLLERPDDTAVNGVSAEQVPTEAENFAVLAPRSTTSQTSTPAESPADTPAGDDDVWASDGYNGDESFGRERSGSFDSDDFRAQSVAEGPS